MFFFCFQRKNKFKCFSKEYDLKIRNSSYELLTQPILYGAISWGIIFWTMFDRFQDYELCVKRGDNECKYLEGGERDDFGQLTEFFCGQEDDCT